MYRVDGSLHTDLNKEDAETVLYYLAYLGMTDIVEKYIGLFKSKHGDKYHINYDGIRVGFARWPSAKETGDENIKVRCWGFRISDGVAQEVHVEG